MNKITIEGYLGQDPLVSFGTSGGKPYCKFSVCVNETYKEKKSTQWFNCITFGESAEKLAETFKKGHTVHVEGKINSSDYTGKDGIKKTYWQVFAFKISQVKEEEKGSFRKMQEELTWADEAERGNDL